MIPYVAVFLMTNFSGIIADLMIHKCHISTGITRKIMNTIGLVIPSIFYFLLRFCKSSLLISTIFIVSAVGISATCRNGYWVNIIDIAPKHASIVMGISNMVATLPGVYL